ASLREARGVLPGGRDTGGEQSDIDALELLGRCGGDVLNNNLLATELQLLACGAGGGEEAHLVSGEVALLEQVAHHLADLAGGADDSKRGHGISVLKRLFREVLVGPRAALRGALRTRQPQRPPA